ncbi:Beta-glucanase [Mucinivorans hirudinis]|uniref:Beta-glucanase n=1 Tax=Mucinivorans hirudinis TaxID=1433126 RepID=A0A060RA37_9BACT|nr:Beta-glucanase [Mucinivorans hirudinis]
MKKILLPFLALILALGCASTLEEPKFVLVWEENFEGNEIDWSIWSKIPRGPSDWNNYMSDYDSLYAVKNGNLILRGINNHTQKSDSAKFLTGGVYTKNKKVFGLGRVEVRAKLGSAKGYWPAFWMLPEKANWPLGGEIDIMEHLNYDNVAYQTLHSNYTFNLKIKEPKPGSVAAINKDDYNIYAVEKYQDSICFFVNGKKTLTYPRIAAEAEKEQFPFCDEPYYLLLDSQLGGNWVGKVDPATLPVEMHIDWVKFYELR